MSAPQKLAETLAACHNLEDGELLLLLRDSGPHTREFLRQQAQAQAQAFYGSQVFIRGLIEFTNFCKNDCYYCGIRRSNPQAQRYRLSQEQILACCQAGYGLGFRTFVLQGGEDPWFTDERLCAMVRAIKERWPDCAVTLSVGERSQESYRLLKEAGADRYLLRHETATPGHYACGNGKAVAAGTNDLSDDAIKGKALSLDGTGSNYLKVTDTDGNALLSGCEELTVSYWRKVDNTGTNWVFFAAADDDAQTYLKEQYLGIIDSATKTEVQCWKNNGIDIRPVRPD